MGDVVRRQGAQQLDHTDEDPLCKLQSPSCRLLHMRHIGRNMMPRMLFFVAMLHSHWFSGLRRLTNGEAHLVVLR